MRVLLLFRAAPGAGKSTFIKEHGLKPYTLCADDLRLLYSSPSLNVDGNYSINQNNDKAVWNSLFKVLETRMQNGEFTVIDATNSKTAEMNRYKELAKNYRYRIYCIDMTDIPIDEVKRRNAGREELKRVPEEVIDKMYSRFATQQIPSGIKVIKPEELDTIWYKSMDLSEYKKIHVIGDIHGSMHPLSRYMRTQYFGFDYDEPEYWRNNKWLTLNDFNYEIWKDVNGYNGKYKISNYGRLKSLNKQQEKIYIYRQYGNGYLYANLSNNSIKTTYKVHQLVWDAFGSDKCEEVNHIDGTHYNNHIYNLEQSNRQLNETHCWENGLKKGRSVIKYNLKHEFIKKYDSVKQACEENGFKFSSGIIKCCNKEFLTSGGYIWEYADEITDNRSGKAIKVLQYTLDDKFIKEYNSIKEAENELRIQTIRNCLSGHQKTAGGFKWKTKEFEYRNKKNYDILLDCKYLSKLFKEDEYYIFTGDYIDRGIENAEVVNYLLNIYKLKNVAMLEGNHEVWLRNYANDINSKSKEFEFVTKPQLDKANISKKSIREFCRSLGQCCYFTYNDKTFLITHGGISNIPDNLLKVATSQMIKGVGQYKDSDDVDKAFCKNTDENTYQIHGHRNVASTPIKSSDRCYNLEGHVEFGGHLRAVQITPNNIETFEIKNDVFKQPEEICSDIMDTGKKDMSIYQVIQDMRKSRYIFERKFGNISSFNFTKEAFSKEVWNDVTTKARGLFVDVNEYKICARSYNKFFNVNQRPETQLSNLKFKFKFPVTAYLKENGFLGIVGWNPEADDLLICSKSTPIGDFANYFKTLLYKLYSEETINKMKDYIKENNVSFVFECCDMENDPHIIEYPESKVVLLDVIKNQIEYEKLPYDKLTELANNMGFVVKEKSYVLNTWEEFYDWYNEVTDEDYKYKDEFIEGFVVEDSNGYMTKLKLYYYNFWKKLRGVAESVYKFGNYKWTGSLTEPIENEFFGWIKNYYVSNDKETAVKDICTLRKMFLEERK